jgi:hypothetical protein
MAKVVVEGDCIAIRVGFFERLMLAERPRKLPLASIRSVDAHPRLVDMMVHWADQGSVWLGGVSAYDGHLIPSTKNPNSTLAIDVDGENERIFVELEGEEPAQVAARIKTAMRVHNGEPEGEDSDEDLIPERPSAAQIQLAALLKEAQAEDSDDEEEEEAEVEGAGPPARMAESAVAPEASLKALGLDNDRYLARLGSWLVGLGCVGVLTGTTIVAAGLVPGLLAVGAGIACGILGGVALAVVANHSD